LKYPFKRKTQLVQWISREKFVASTIRETRANRSMIRE
jgi:hypothetical protein